MIEDIWERTGYIHRLGSWIAIPISRRALARISSCSRLLARIISWCGAVGVMEVIIMVEKSREIGGGRLR